jgi:rubrerythrin
MSVWVNGEWIAGVCHRPSRGLSRPPIKAEEGIRKTALDTRLAYERRHDTDARIANVEAVHAARLAELVADAWGRCSCCGELIGEVFKCPICGTQQGAK